MTPGSPVSARRATELTIFIPPDLAPRVLLQPMRLRLTGPLTEAGRDALAADFAARYPRDVRAEAQRAARQVLAGIALSPTGHPRITSPGVAPAARQELA